MMKKQNSIFSRHLHLISHFQDGRNEVQLVGADGHNSTPENRAGDRQEGAKVPESPRNGQPRD